MDSAFPLIFGVFMIAMLVIGIISANIAKKKAEERRAALVDLASRLGLQFSSGIFNHSVQIWGPFSTEGKETETFLTPFQGMSPFGQGHSQQVSNIISGTFGGGELLAFDYLYKITTSNGKSTTTTTYNVQVLKMSVPFWLPYFSLQPENFLLAIGDKLGIREIKFESEEFNKKWFVRGTDTKTVYEFLHPRAMERLLNVGPYRWEFGGNSIVVIENRYLSVPEIDRAITDIADLVALTPNYFRQDRKI